MKHSGKILHFRNELDFKCYFSMLLAVSVWYKTPPTFLQNYINNAYLGSYCKGLDKHYVLR